MQRRKARLGRLRSVLINGLITTNFRIVGYSEVEPLPRGLKAQLTDWPSTGNNRRVFRKSRILAFSTMGCSNQVTYAQVKRRCGIHVKRLPRSNELQSLRRRGVFLSSLQLWISQSRKLFQRLRCDPRDLFFDGTAASLTL